MTLCEFNFVVKNSSNGTLLLNKIRVADNELLLKKIGVWEKEKVVILQLRFTQENFEIEDFELIGEDVNGNKKEYLFILGENNKEVVRIKQTVK